MMSRDGIYKFLKNISELLQEFRQKFWHLVDKSVVQL